MLFDIISVVIVVAVLCAVFSVPVGIFNLKVFRAMNGTKCTGLNLIKAFIPFYNITFSRKLAYGGALGFTIGLIVCLVLLLFRIISLVLVTSVPILVVFSSISTIACLVLYYVLYVINAVDFCRMFNCGLVTILCCIFIAPIGYYMMSTQVLGYFRAVEDTVSGRFGAED